MCLTHLTRISKIEKDWMMKSYIVREGRSNVLQIDKDDLFQENYRYLPPKNSFKNNSTKSVFFYDENMDLLINLTEKITLIFDTRVPVHLHHYCKRIFEFILRFPERFDKCNLSIEFSHYLPPEPLLL